jgi:hypothetical protein
MMLLGPIGQFTFTSLEYLYWRRIDSTEVRRDRLDQFYDKNSLYALNSLNLRNSEAPNS